MCVCVCACVTPCACVRVHTRALASSDPRSVFDHVCAAVCVSMIVCVYDHVCAAVCACVCVCVCMVSCVCVCVYTQRVFKEFDLDGSGLLDRREMARFIKKLMPELTDSR